MKRSIWPLTLAFTAVLLAFLGFTGSLFAQSPTDLPKPASGTLIDLGDRGPTPADAGIRAHSNVELFVPTGTARPFGSPSGPPTGAETPASLACIYQLVPGPYPPGCPISGTSVNPSGGSGWIFIVEPYDDPTAASDLAAFASYYGMPTPKFGTVYAQGKPATAPANWLLEEATAIEWAYAMAPNATIILVEAYDPTLNALMQAEDGARGFFTFPIFCIPLQYCGYYGEISNSWTSAEWSGETSYDIHFAPPRNCGGIFCFQNSSPMVIFAASGNFPGVYWPSASPWVVSAGGTTINRDASGNFTGESVWYSPPNGGGGGPSQYEPIPTWQMSLNYLLRGQRGTPDLSIEANPASGVGVYVTCSTCFPPYTGWTPGLVGGTSLASPLLAGIVNSAGNFYGGGTLDSNYNPYSYTPENALLYSELAGAVTYRSYFRDIGADSFFGGQCGQGGKYNSHNGWDFCTGIGTPLTLIGK
jgi:kumamolisin